MRHLLDTLLTPIARLAIARGQGFAEVAERLKVGFFRAALKVAGPDATDSRLSLLTGLQRREIIRLRIDVDRQTPRRVNHLSRLVALWQADPAYDGQPLVRRGPPPSFDALAQIVRRDVHPKSLLDQLFAARTVTEQDGLIRLLQPSYQPLAGTEAQLDYLAMNVGDHLTAALANVTEAPRHLDRAVHYNQLTPEAVATLDTLWRERITAAMSDVNAKALEFQRTTPGTHRFRAGAYFWQEDEG
jgi:hypothetical protein